MTLNVRTALYCTTDVSLGTCHGNFEDPYYLRQKCSPGTLLSGSIRLVRIFLGVS